MTLLANQNYVNLLKIEIGLNNERHSHWDTIYVGAGEWNYIELKKPELLIGF